MIKIQLFKNQDTTDHHTSYLSQSPQTCLCKNYLSGVNFSRLSEKKCIYLTFSETFLVFLVPLVVFLGVKFGFRKSCLCKRNDKYKVCKQWLIFGSSFFMGILWACIIFILLYFQTMANSITVGLGLAVLGYGGRYIARCCSNFSSLIMNMILGLPPTWLQNLRLLPNLSISSCPNLIWRLGRTPNTTRADLKEKWRRGKLRLYWGYPRTQMPKRSEKLTNG